MGTKRKAKAAALDDYGHEYQSRFNKQIPLCPTSSNEPCRLTDRCRHHSSQDEVPRHLIKYWQQRYDIFSRYDEGVVMTDDAWFGATPEPVANTIALTLAKTSRSRTTIVDLFAGVGGNTIAFALATPHRWQRIIGVEIDPETLACARHNADLYGVGDRITWVCADSLVEFLDPQYDPQRKCEEVDPSLRLEFDETVLFASPPWGGQGYRHAQVFDLDVMEPYNIGDLEYYCQDMPHALYLPRTSDVRQIARLVHGDGNINVRQYCLNGASKALVAYIAEKAVFDGTKKKLKDTGQEENEESSPVFYSPSSITSTSIAAVEFSGETDDDPDYTPAGGFSQEPENPSGLGS